MCIYVVNALHRYFFVVVHLIMLLFFDFFLWLLRSLHVNIYYCFLLLSFFIVVAYHLFCTLHDRMSHYTISLFFFVLFFLLLLKNIIIYNYYSGKLIAQLSLFNHLPFLVIVVFLHFFPVFCCFCSHTILRPSVNRSFALTKSFINTLLFIKYR